MEITKKSILETGRGSIMERVDYEMSKVLDNILDVNTKATAKRKITVTLEITPDDDRGGFTLGTTSKSTLAPTNPVRTSFCILGDRNTGEVQIVENTPQVPGQLNLDGEESEPPVVLNVIDITQGGYQSC